MGRPGSRSSLVQKSRPHVEAEMKAASWRSGKGWLTESHSTFADHNLRGIVRSPSPPTTNVYISNVCLITLYGRPFMWSVISRFCQIKIKDLYMIALRERPVISDDYRHGDISYMFVDETASGRSSDCSPVV
jgi:hypothetical protein